MRIKKSPLRPPSAMRVRELIVNAAMRLRASGSPDPEADAAWLMSDALRVSRGALVMHLEESLSGEALDWFERALKKREGGEPLQYVEGFAWFMGRRFFVDARVLIPRSDTEILLECALGGIRPGGRVLDLCTGSGVLAISIALSVPGADVIGADISQGALDVAAINAEALNARVLWAQGDLFGAIEGDFDLIVCNPPYLTARDMSELQREVRREPAAALFGGEDGLDFYRRIAAELPKRLRSGGRAMFEVGLGQAAAVAGMLEGIGHTQKIPDLSGAERVVTVERV